MLSKGELPRDLLPRMSCEEILPKGGLLRDVALDELAKYILVRLKCHVVNNIESIKGGVHGKKPMEHGSRPRRKKKGSRGCMKGIQKSTIRKQ